MNRVETFIYTIRDITNFIKSYFFKHGIKVRINFQAFLLHLLGVLYKYVLFIVVCYYYYYAIFFILIHVSINSETNR